VEDHVDHARERVDDPDAERDHLRCGAGSDRGHDHPGRDDDDRHYPTAPVPTESTATSCCPPGDSASATMSRKSSGRSVSTTILIERKPAAHESYPRQR